VYRSRGDQLAETALWSSPLADVQVALRDAGDDGQALLQVHVRPLLAWVWWGALLLVAGGAWAAPSRMLDRCGRQSDHNDPEFVRSAA
jgi:cytochrome c biogenesis factor